MAGLARTVCLRYDGFQPDMRILAFALFGCAVVSSAATIAEKTAGTQKMAGYFPMYWDEKSGKLWLEVDKLDQDFLYASGLAAGLGSNDIGLDRAQLGAERVVRFERVANRVFLVEKNLNFRAVSNDAAERAAVEQSFGRSVHWGFAVEAEDGGKVLVDATPFFLRDVHDVAGTLARQRQGSFRLDANRSAFYLPRTRNFPKNTEVEVTLTLTSDQPGPLVRRHAPFAGAITIREHHSLIELPDSTYKTRDLDPRAPFNGIEFMDYATPVSERIVKRFIARHRLEKKSGSDEPVKPIVYYVDRGAPEPIRTALLEGASWWNQAFEAAGFRNAFRVEVMPADADPMDVRYNVINWVHRSTRGWSYGGSISDPRTGEILKGHVTLGSLRVRQDYMIAEGVIAPYEEGKPVSPKMLEMGLARLRQLSAHEVGHTLGITHNFAASVKNRASVMDYPHPWIDLAGAGAPTLDNAYATGIGEWDKISINFGYRQFAPGEDEKKGLDAILRKAASEGYQFITDSDSRPEGSAHPAGHLWDSGANAAAELNRLLQVRARALERFGENSIRAGEPWSNLENVLAPVYLLHRYQTEAAAKSVGGLYYTYSIRGDGQKITEVVPGAEQRKALDALLATLKPEALALSPKLLAMMPPTAFGYDRDRENFRGRTGLTFDAQAPVEAAAGLTARLILNPQRAARLIQQRAADPAIDGLGEVIDRLVAATWKGAKPAGALGEVQRTVNTVVLYQLMALVHDTSAAAQARAIGWAKLEGLRKYLGGAGVADPLWQAHFEFAAAQIKYYQENPKEIPITRPAEAPPGQPIGCDWN